MLRRRFSILLFLLLQFVASGFSQEVADLEQVENDPKREEIQRYFGYESLIYRYLTQPYDMTINVNQKGDFVDVGFIYLMLFPVLFLVLAGSRNYLVAIILISISCLWIISVSNSFVYANKARQQLRTEAEINTFLNSPSAESEPISRTTAKIYNVGKRFYAPFGRFEKLVSGQKDRFTYPFLFFLFFVLAVVLFRALTLSTPTIRIFFGFNFLYFFYWILFGGGIVWYCYILFPVSMLSIILLIQKIRARNQKLGTIYSSVFIGIGVIWFLLASVFRISLVAPNLPKHIRGKRMFNYVFYNYGTGNLSKDQVLQTLYPQLNSALEQINQDTDSYIYKVGTSFTYFIKNNNERVFQDNQLGTLYWLLRMYKDKEELAKVLKASNFKYLILDLNTEYIDNTPDSALKKKYKSLREYIDDNPTFKLISTDNLVQPPKDGSSSSYVHNTVGEKVRHGSYAIYEII